MTDFTATNVHAKAAAGPPITMLTALKDVVRLQGQLKSLYSAIGLEWGKDTPEDAEAVLKLLFESYMGSGGDVG